MDNRNCLSWEEWIRLNDVTLPHVLEMQDIILDQETIIKELEAKLKDKEQLLNSFDFITLENELDWVEQCCGEDAKNSLIEITKILDNYKLRCGHE